MNLYNRMLDRMTFVRSREMELGGMDRLPRDAADSLCEVVEHIRGMAADQSSLKPIPDANMENTIREKRIAAHARKLIGASKKRMASGARINV
jgi:hypothetical protein